MNTLNVLITPSFMATRDKIGFSEDEDYNSDAVLFQQGYDMDVLKVDLGDTFEIADEYTGQINCEETQFKFIKLKEEWEEEPNEWDDDFQQEGDPINLEPGYYKFLENGITIQEITEDY